MSPITYTSANPSSNTSAATHPPGDDTDIVQINADLQSRLHSIDAFLARLIEQDCLEHILRRIKHWGAGHLDPAMMSEVVQDVLLSVWRMWHRKKILEDLPLRSVFHATKCCALDSLRYLTRKKRDGHNSPLSCVVGDLLAAVPPPGDDLEAAELVNALKVITTDHLTPLQKKVFDAYCEIRKDTWSNRSSLVTLAARVSTTRKQATPTQVRSALREALRKVRDELAHLGWVPDKEAKTREGSGTPTRTRSSEHDLPRVGE